MAIEPDSAAPGGTCYSGQYSLELQNDTVQPSPPLPTPNVIFDPAYSADGNCTKIDSTLVTFSVPSPIPQGNTWDVHWGVVEKFQYCGITCQMTKVTLGFIYLHTALHIQDLDAGSKDIQNSNWERVVGQRVNLKVIAPTASTQISNCSWTAPKSDAIVGSYGSYSGATPPAMLAPSPAPLFSNAPTGVTAVKYYWSQPFAVSPLSVTCDVQQTGATPDPISAQVNVDTVAPTYSIAATFGSINLGPFYDPSSSITSLNFGNFYSPSPTFGLQATYTVNMPPNYGGYFGPNQTIKSTLVKVPAPSPTPASSGSQTWLDGCDIYTSQYSPNGQNDITIAGVQWAGPGSTANFTTEDSTFEGLDKSLSSVSISDSFITTLMFKPNTGPNGTSLSNTIWIPLESLTWSYAGSAQNVAPDPSASPLWVWTNTSPAPNPTQQPAAGSYSSTSSPMPTVFTNPATFPTWTGAVPPPTTPCPSVPG